MLSPAAPCPRPTPGSFCPLHPGQTRPGSLHLTEPGASLQPTSQHPLYAGWGWGGAQRRSTPCPQGLAVQPGGSGGRGGTPRPPRASCLGRGGERPQRVSVSLRGSRGGTPGTEPRERPEWSGVSCSPTGRLRGQRRLRLGGYGDESGGDEGEVEGELGRLGEAGGEVGGETGGDEGGGPGGPGLRPLDGVGRN